jgi:hypothetical protein
MTYLYESSTPTESMFDVHVGFYSSFYRGDEDDAGGRYAGFTSTGFFTWSNENTISSLAFFLFTNTHFAVPTFTSRFTHYCIR